jgi:flavin reductase (DIM6/NTAB) family NADH-FMN oxidoreductase RutF
MARIEAQPLIQPSRFRQVMGRFATGVAVIATAVEGRVHGMTANAFASGSLDPPLCVIAVGKTARMHDYLTASGHFSVNMLRQSQEQLSRHFAGRPVSGLTPPFDLVGETPVLSSALATVAARVTAHHDCGDHTLFIGAIFHLHASEGEPLVFYGGHYVSLARTAVETMPVPEFW